MKCEHGKLSFIPSVQQIANGKTFPFCLFFVSFDVKSEEIVFECVFSSSFFFAFLATFFFSFSFSGDWRYASEPKKAISHEKKKNTSKFKEKNDKCI